MGKCRREKKMVGIYMCKIQSNLIINDHFSHFSSKHFAPLHSTWHRSTAICKSSSDKSDRMSHCHHKFHLHSEFNASIVAFCHRRCRRHKFGTDSRNSWHKSFLMAFFPLLFRFRITNTHTHSHTYTSHSLSPSRTANICFAFCSFVLFFTFILDCHLIRLFRLCNWSNFYFFFVLFWYGIFFISFRLCERRAAAAETAATKFVLACGVFGLDRLGYRHTMRLH